MSLQDQLKKAEAEAEKQARIEAIAIKKVKVFEGTMAHLAEQRQTFHTYAKVLSTEPRLELPYAFDGDYVVVILPVQHVEGTVEQALAHEVLKVLKENGAEVTVTKVGGSTAYRLPKDKARIKSELTMPLRGLEFKLGFTRVEGLDVNYVPPEDDVPKKKSKRTSAKRTRSTSWQSVDLAEYHTPTVQVGDKFEVVLYAKRNFEHYLLNVKGHSIPNETREKFPGFGVPFLLRFNDEVVLTHVTSGSHKTGDKLGMLRGNYLKKNIKDLLGKTLDELGYDHVKPAIATFRAVGLGTPFKVTRAGEYGSKENHSKLAQYTLLSLVR